MIFETLFVVAALARFLSFTPSAVPDEKPPVYHSFDYEAARAHEFEPYRHKIPLRGIHPGFNQLHLKLKVSVSGDVVEAKAEGDPATLKFWRNLKPKCSIGNSLRLRKMEKPWRRSSKSILPWSLRSAYQRFM
jgi:hypothetical protein